MFRSFPKGDLFDRVAESARCHSQEAGLAAGDGDSAIIS